MVARGFGYSGPDRNYAAGKGATHGFLYGHAQPSGVGRRGKGPGGGQIINSSEARELNRWMALELQKRVVTNMAGSYKRPKVSTGRLLQVTGAPGNTKYGIDYFGVGVPEFLDKSQSLYWRTIEEGSAAVWKRPFIGTRLVGVWGGSKGGMYESARWGTVLRGGPPITSTGASTGGKFIPVGASARDGQEGRFGARVTKEIAPMHAYAKAWKQFGAGKRVLDDYLKMIDRELAKGRR